MKRSPVYFICMLLIFFLVSCEKKQTKTLLLTQEQKYEKQLQVLKKDLVNLRKAVSEGAFSLDIKKETPEQKQEKKTNREIYKAKKYILNERMRQLLNQVENHLKSISAKEINDADIEKLVLAKENLQVLIDKIEKLQKELNYRH